jgi:hypothetical protein
MSASINTYGVISNDEVAINQCRICLENDKKENLLIPCHFRGTAAFVHRNCLSNWMIIRGTDSCNVCNTTYNWVSYEKRNKNLTHYLLEEQGVWQYLFVGTTVYGFLPYASYESVVESKQKLSDLRFNFVLQTWILIGYVIWGLTFFGSFFRVFGAFMDIIQRMEK